MKFIHKNHPCLVVLALDTRWLSMKSNMRGRESLCRLCNDAEREECTSTIIDYKIRDAGEGKGLGLLALRDFERGEKILVAVLDLLVQCVVKLIVTNSTSHISSGCCHGPRTHSILKFA